MPRRNRKTRSRRSRSNAVSTVSTIKPVENGLRIIQWSESENSGPVPYTIGIANVQGRSWKISSFEFTLVAAAPARVEITLFGSDEQTSTKDISVGTVPTVLRFRTPRRADYNFTPATTTDDQTAFIIASSAPLVVNAIARITLKPLRDNLTARSLASAVRGSEL